MHSETVKFIRNLFLKILKLFKRLSTWHLADTKLWLEYTIQMWPKVGWGF